MLKNFFIKHTIFSAFLAGLLFPLGFAPFHKPGLAIVSLAILFALLNSNKIKTSIIKIFFHGFTFGFAAFIFGVSWVYISIHDYGQLNSFISLLITFGFVGYLAIYPGCAGIFYYLLNQQKFRHDSLKIIYQAILFASCWTLSEYIRSTLFGGFPWISVGFGQIDSPLKLLLPVTGIYGLSFLTSLSAPFLVYGLRNSGYWLIICVIIYLIPMLFSNHKWTQHTQTPISVGIVQVNNSIRGEWSDSAIFNLLKKYNDGISALIDQSKIIVLPESAIPLPKNYLNNYFINMHEFLHNNDGAILLGMPEASERGYYNAMVSLGKSKGNYYKQQLVPFGEFIPEKFQKIVNFLQIPVTNLSMGNNNQKLIEVHDIPIASLICFEIAYPEILRKQLPKARFIVSISDNGWFGKSFAVYQQIQMATALSIASERYQIFANNDGLSSIINPNGKILNSLNAFEAGILSGTIYEAQGYTPWSKWGDMPILFICSIFVLISATIIYFLNCLTHKYLTNNETS